MSLPSLSPNSCSMSDSSCIGELYILPMLMSAMLIAIVLFIAPLREKEMDVEGTYRGLREYFVFVWWRMLDIGKLVASWSRYDVWVLRWVLRRGVIVLYLSLWKIFTCTWNCINTFWGFLGNSIKFYEEDFLSLSHVVYTLFKFSIILKCIISDLKLTIFDTPLDNPIF